MAILYMDKQSVCSLNEVDIKNIIKKNSTNMKYQKMEDYYIGKHSILYHPQHDPSLPNNKIVCNMAKYITDTATGYFLGKTVTYTSMNEQQMQIVQDIFDYNDEQDENMELAKYMSIDGHIFEMLYMDENSNIRFTMVRPDSAIYIYESGTDTLLAVIRFIYVLDKNDKEYKYVEYWTDTFCMTFKSVNKAPMQYVGIEDHYWHDVPFVEYLNNTERLGDYEGIISLIDAYNKVQTNTANLFEYNDNALMKISKMGDVNTMDIKQMKEDGAVILEDGGDINWLIKDVPDAAIENYKNRLRKDMHQFSTIPDMTDDGFGGQLSGVAISYKVWSFEQTTITKERKFKKGLQRRLELITNMLNLMGHAFDYRDIQVTFRRNKPQDISEIADIVNKLAPYLSESSLLSLLPVIEDPAAEMDKKEQETIEDMKRFNTGNYGNLSPEPDVVNDEK